MAKDLVVLLHGILRSKTDMLPLSLYLKKHGFETINLLYPSREKGLEDLTEYVHEKIQTHLDNGQTLHFVTHSMGGLIARYYIAKYTPKNLGKVVMLAPPNTGSEFADFFTGNVFLKPWYEKIFGPAGLQLTTAHGTNHPPITYPVGIIAGTHSINPLAFGVLPSHHDGIVTVERTRLDGMTDHITMPVTHTFMMFNPKVMSETLEFLNSGSFTTGQARASGSVRP